MEKRTIHDFGSFEMNKTNLDQVKGGAKVDEKIVSKTGVGYCGNVQTIMIEQLICYDDGTFTHKYFYITGEECK